jgi:hypothetical protein
MYATPGARGRCPGCRSVLFAACGVVRIPHWRHPPHAPRCDPWSKPEGEWHRQWKRRLAEDDPQRIEVIVTDPAAGTWHRADVVTRDGWVLELQSAGLSSAQTKAREDFYTVHGPGMAWFLKGSCLPSGEVALGTIPRLLAACPLFVEGGGQVLGVRRTGPAEHLVWGRWTVAEFLAQLAGGLAPLLAGYEASKQKPLATPSAQDEERLSKAARHARLEEADRALMAAERERVRKKEEQAKREPREALQQVQQDHPHLTPQGFTDGTPSVPWLDEEAVAAFQSARDKLRNMSKQPSVQWGASTSHGPLIAAAVHLHFKMVPEGGGRSGAFFNIASSTLRRIERELGNPPGPPLRGTQG